MRELMYVKMINRLSRQRILMHVLFWLAVTFFFFHVFRRDDDFKTILDNLGFMPGHMFFAYSLNYFIFPRYVLKGKLTSAVICVLVSLLISLLYLRLIDIYLLHYSSFGNNWALWIRHSMARAIVALFSVGWIAATIKLVKRWYVEKETQQRLEKEKLVVELQLLKSQLHPHFLFNTLNSLYSLTLERSLQAPQTVLKLSGLLRYILYECNVPQVSLTREVESITNYIELEKTRFGERLDLSLSFTGDIDNKTIAPLLLLPFVENSIKHGTGEQLDKSWIHLQLHVQGDTLTFRLINSKEDTQSQSAPAHSPYQNHGLGLQNVQRRLNLLYPGQHTLKLTSQEDTYQATLTLRLAAGKEANQQSFPDLTPIDHEAQVSYS
ncbi:MAG: histidine kinase [Bacteroidetes bacterium]|nr:histidine kinase [Bacteroidota bacterium]